MLHNLRWLLLLLTHLLACGDSRPSGGGRPLSGPSRSDEPSVDPGVGASAAHDASQVRDAAGDDARPTSPDAPRATDAARDAGRPLDGATHRDGAARADAGSAPAPDARRGGADAAPRVSPDAAPAASPDAALAVSPDAARLGSPDGAPRVSLDAATSTPDAALRAADAPRAPDAAHVHDMPGAPDAGLMQSDARAAADAPVPVARDAGLAAPDAAAASARPDAAATSARPDAAAVSARPDAAGSARPDAGCVASVSCASSGLPCGTVADGCGRTLRCGACGGAPLPADPRTLAAPVAGDDPLGLRLLLDGAGTRAPVQEGVAPGALAPARAAVIRGVVWTRDPARCGSEEVCALPGAVVRTLGAPELGLTRTRLDGRFDLVVEASDGLTLDITSEGRLAAQRTLRLAPGEIREAPPVVLVSLDPEGTPVALDGSGARFQVAQGSVSSDADGSRRSTLLFAPGTRASLVVDGAERPVDGSAVVRATEYTVGRFGAAAMPGSLPPESGYTYAVEWSLDEALALGASEVRFDRPVVAYVEDFVGLPNGLPVPVGAYDRARALVPGPGWSRRDGAGCRRRRRRTR